MASAPPIQAPRTTGDNQDTIGSGVGAMERELSERKFDPAAKKPMLFKMRAALPKQGRGQAMLAATDRMWTNLKVYASGGENELHAHTNEDHVFFILQGGATFHGPGGETITLSRLEGIMLPRGTVYSFTADESEPLVLLRVGCVVDAEQSPWGRVGADGNKLTGTDAGNKAEPTIFYTDRFFE